MKTNMIFGTITVLTVLFTAALVFDWRRWAKFLFGSMLFLPLLFLLFIALASFFFPNFGRVRTTRGSPAGWCRNNMRQIQGATEQVILEHTYKGAELSAAEIARYVKGQAIPKCPGGGVYRLGTTHEKPSCSKHGALTE